MGTAVLIALAILPADARAWGPRGHILVTRAALAASPSLPSWFREAERALVELSIAPDRWREMQDEVPALKARAADHFFELDAWGAATLPVERWAYVREASRRRLDPADVGFLPFALLEEYGVLTSAFRDVRAGRPGAREQALASAGTLAHLAGDAAVPLHATRHHDGWVGENPRGFRRARGVHHWFESEMLPRNDPGWLEVRPGSVDPSADVRRDVGAMLGESLAAVPRLYEAELRAHRSGDTAAAQALVRERAAAGARLLGAVWQAAWEQAQRR
jgi:hypothetical protein